MPMCHIEKKPFALKRPEVFLPAERSNYTVTRWIFRRHTQQSVCVCNIGHSGKEGSRGNREREWEFCIISGKQCTTRERGRMRDLRSRCALKLSQHKSHCCNGSDDNRQQHKERKESVRSTRGRHKIPCSCIDTQV